MPLMRSVRSLRRSLLTAATSLILLSPACGHAATLVADLNALLSSPDLKGSISGVIVSDVRTGHVLYAHNADVCLIPASNRKLFTAVAALDSLGADYVLKTNLLTDGLVLGDTIRGSVYLRGGGDALLTADDIKAMAAKVYASGVRHITGDIVGDATLFDDGPYPEGWSWDYLADDYAAQFSALEAEQGVIGVSIAPAQKLGEKGIVTLVPATAYVPIDNETTTADPGIPENLNVTRPYNKAEIIITGAVPFDYKQAKPFPVTVDNPALYATTLLTEDLLTEGVTVDGMTKLGATPAKAVGLAEHDSVPLGAYLPFMLKPSNNLIAECLIRVIGAAKGTSGDYKGGYAIEKLLYAKMGIDDDELDFADGSGVTRLDLVTPRAISKLLIAVANQADFKLIYDALPIAGVDGTLRLRMKGTLAEDNAHAKTGTVRFAHALSGYVTDQDSDILAFSIINNNYEVPTSAINTVQDAFVSRLAAEQTLGIPVSAPKKPSAAVSPSKPEPSDMDRVPDESPTVSPAVKAPTASSATPAPATSVPASTASNAYTAPLPPVTTTSTPSESGNKPSAPNAAPIPAKPSTPNEAPGSSQAPSPTAPAPKPSAPGAGPGASPSTPGTMQSPAPNPVQPDFHQPSGPAPSFPPPTSSPSPGLFPPPSSSTPSEPFPAVPSSP